MKKLEEMTNAQLAKFLPDAMKNAIESYKSFAARLTDGEANKLIDSKVFKADHDACKAAISHIEKLLKLARELVSSGDKGAGDKVSQGELANMIKSAQAEVEKYKE